MASFTHSVVLKFIEEKARTFFSFIYWKAKNNVIGINFFLIGNVWRDHFGNVFWHPFQSFWMFQVHQTKQISTETYSWHYKIHNSFMGNLTKFSKFIVKSNQRFYSDHLRGKISDEESANVRISWKKSSLFKKKDRKSSFDGQKPFVEEVVKTLIE